jgi:hypothetical protein
MSVYTPECPVDISFIDPEGFVTEKGWRGIADSTYVEFDMDGDGDEEDKITITTRI